MQGMNRSVTSSQPSCFATVRSFPFSRPNAVHPGGQYPILNYFLPPSIIVNWVKGLRLATHTIKFLQDIEP
jgi:hypothetical protein